MPAALSEASVGLVGLEDIQDGGRGGITIRATQPQEIESLKTRFVTGDILYGKLRPYLNKVGIAPQAGLCSTEIWAFGPSALVDTRFAAFFLASSFFVDRVQSLTKGANLPRLDTEAFDSIEIPLPPLSEQQRIVEILQEAESIRLLHAEAESKFAELIPAIFADTFGDLYFGKSPFPVRSLSSIGELDRGKSKHRPRDEPSLYGGPYPFIQTGDVAQSNGWITRFSQTYSEKGLEQSRLWPKGTLAITIAANIGSTAILTFDACFPDSIVGFTPSTGNCVEFVRWWLLGYQKKLEIQAPQGAQKNINLDVLRAIQIPVPPTKLQQRFKEAIQNLREQLEASVAGAKTLATLTASLSAHAFSGQLTADWREKHTDGLFREARERDETLKSKAGKTRFVDLSSRGAISISGRVGLTVDVPADGIYAELNREQKWLLQEIYNTVGITHTLVYFSAKTLAQSIKGALQKNPQAIEGHLTVFAARGLIISVSREEQTKYTGEFVFGNAYRLPIRYSGGRPQIADDGDSLEPEPFLSEHVRLDELARIGARLEKERGLT